MSLEGLRVGTVGNNEELCLTPQKSNKKLGMAVHIPFDQVVGKGRARSIT